jgi:thiol-disulfide isomerase/thioredoxin
LEKNKEGLAKHLAAAASSTVPVDLEAARSATPEDGLTALFEANKDTFYPTLEAAGDALVVVDFYTGSLALAARRRRRHRRGAHTQQSHTSAPPAADWCGPCKLIAPKLVAWHAELQPKVKIIKFKCAPSRFRLIP